MQYFTLVYFFPRFFVKWEMLRQTWAYYVFLMINYRESQMFRKIAQNWNQYCTKNRWCGITYTVPVRFQVEMQREATHVPVKTHINLVINTERYIMNKYERRREVIPYKCVKINSKCHNKLWDGWWSGFQQIENYCIHSRNSTKLHLICGQKKKKKRKEKGHLKLMS